ncbi:MAG TPA: RraA family protein [Trueperaceae bacterium]|nr:RraA family protein [Trueperaceae bacterium]
MRQGSVDDRNADSWLRPYLGLSSGTLGHLSSDGFLDWEIQPLFRPVRMVGPALTVACQPTDNAPLAEAMSGAAPGTVMVVARYGDRRHAPWGGLMSRIAHGRGLAGTVIDGAATDWREIVELQYPVFARNLSALTTRRQNLPASVGEPVVCGGVLVRTGDVVIGDDDGVVVVPAERAEEYLAKALRFEQWEHVFRTGLKEGLEPKVARARADEAVPR